MSYPLSTCNRSGRFRRRPAVTTTGRIHVEPNLAAAIPGKVTFTIDARHPDPAKVQELWDGHEALIRDVAHTYDVEASWSLLVDHEPGPSAPGLVELLETTAAEQGIPALSMYSGGGHDSQQMDQGIVGVRHQPGGSRRLVFPNTHGAPYNPNNVLARLTCTLAAADLPNQRLHDVRHYAATCCPRECRCALS